MSVVLLVIGRGPRKKLTQNTDGMHAIAMPLLQSSLTSQEKGTGREDVCPPLLFPPQIARFHINLFAGRDETPVGGR